MQKAFGKKSVIFLFIFPAFLIYTAFVIVSIIWAGYYSFFDWSGVGEKVFVGLKNYIELITQDEVFRATIGHTLVYTVINVAIQVFGGLLFAILLSRIKKGRIALQTLYYIPVVISSVAICQIFTKLLSVTPTGIVNQVLSLINPSWKLMEWISNPQVSLYVTAFVEAYKYLGLYMVIFYAALIGVPDELGEAALIDGCTRWKTFWSVVFPLLKPTIATVAVIDAMAFWNDYLLPSLVLRKKEMYTLPIAMQVFYGTYTTDIGLILAALLLAMLPILILYVFLQRYIIEGVTSGAVKG